MAIIVKPPTTPPPEPDIHISFDDAEWIKETKAKMGTIPAVKLTRLIARCGLATAHRFVTSLD